MKNGRLLLFLQVFLLSCGAKAGEFEDLFQERVTNALGKADRRGHVSMWYELSDAVQMEGARLPIALHFGTGADTAVGRMFGAHWFCPLLESSVVEIAENSVIAWTPGGKPIQLYSASGQPDRFHSKDLKWQGVRNGSAFTLTGVGGDSIRFHKGRIETYQSSDGLACSWVYEGGALSSLTLKGESRPLVKISYTADGLVDKIHDQDGAAYRFQYTEVPQLVTIQGQPVVSNIKKTLSSADKGGKRLFDLAMEYIPEEASCRLVEKGPGSPAKSVTWSADGSIISDEKQRYMLESQGEKIRRPKIVAIGADGVKSWYAYNPVTGVAERQQNGVFEKSFYILSPGPGFGHVRLVETIDPEGKVSKVYSKVLDKDGRPLKKTFPNGDVHRYTYQGDGKVEHMERQESLTRESFTVKWEGDVPTLINQAGKSISYKGLLKNATLVKP